MGKGERAELRLNLPPVSVQLCLPYTLGHSTDSGTLKCSALCFMLSGVHAGYFIYLNWMPTYFYKVLGE